MFDPQWILDTLTEKADWFKEAVGGVVDGLTAGIIQAVFDTVEPYLDDLAAEFLERRPEVEEWF